MWCVARALFVAVNTTLPSIATMVMLVVKNLMVSTVNDNDIVKTMTLCVRCGRLRWLLTLTLRCGTRRRPAAMANIQHLYLFLFFDTDPEYHLGMAPTSLSVKRFILFLSAG